MTRAVTPDGIDGLLAAAEAALPLVQRFDGPEVRWPDKDFVAIGLNPLDPEIRAARVPAGMGTESSTQIGDVVCMIRSTSGDRGVRPRRVRAYQMLDALVDQLAADPTLGGRVSHAEVIDETYAPSQTRGAIAVDLLFTVQCRRF